MADNIPRELDSSDLEIIRSMLEDMLGPCFAPLDNMYCPQGATFLDQIENRPPLQYMCPMSTGPCFAPLDNMYCPQGATFLDQIENQPPLLYMCPMSTGPCFAPLDNMYCPQGATFLDQIENRPPLHNVSAHSFNQEKQTNPVPKPCPPQPSTSKQQHGGAVNKEPYIRRPPNAFMVFMRENRDKVSQTLKPKHSVEANTILGQMWRNMSSEEQQEYYEKAAEERRLHSEKHPEWSSKDNYGKKVKRQRRKGIVI
ncbi:protein pop-1-like isoform X3 [Synchiropus splendidus]|uniref:protein pop-1-like isoform X3 n=1 Tax=Synchiropus splendidus TaxID=270530 RepID=UPI00237D9897|nr:protein pop-1-like isoform X3 [Synchiropus splendidus]